MEPGSNIIHRIGFIGCVMVGSQKEPCVNKPGVLIQNGDLLTFDEFVFHLTHTPISTQDEAIQELLAVARDYASGKGFYVEGE